MIVYLKDDYELDFGTYISKIYLINSKVSDMLDKFKQSLKELESKDDTDLEIIEDLGAVKIDEDLFNSLSELTDNLRNQMFFNSLAISVFSFLEFSLIEYCRLIDLYIDSEKKFRNYPKSGLEKVKEYLKEKFEIDFGTINNWGDVNKFQKIRNLIVHNDSNLIKDYNLSLEKQEDYKLLSQMSNDISITTAGYIFIKRFEYLDNIKIKEVELINDIIDKTQKMIKKHDRKT
jgi:hypothetical protein